MYLYPVCYLIGYIKPFTPKSLSFQLFHTDERHLDIYADGFCIRDDFLYEVEW